MRGVLESPYLDSGPFLPVAKYRTVGILRCLCLGWLRLSSDQCLVEDDMKRRAVLLEDDADLALQSLVLVRSEACPTECFIITCRTWLPGTQPIRVCMNLPIPVWYFPVDC